MSRRTDGRGLDQAGEPMRYLCILETVKIDMIELANLLAGERKKEGEGGGEEERRLQHLEPAGTWKHGLAPNTDLHREAAGGGGGRSQLGGWLR